MIVRPVGARIVAYGGGVCLVVMSVVIAMALPPEVQGAFSPSQIGTLILMLLAALGVLWGIGRSKVETDDDGVRILNGYRRHQFAWPQIREASLGRGAPWGSLYVGSAGAEDDRTIMLFAIQGSDGPRAREAMKVLRQEIRARH